MKPILFNTDMVRPILDDQKTVTRRVVQMPDTITAETVDRVRMKNGLAHFSWSLGEAFAGFDVKPTYRPGDILYVRETWAAWSRTMGTHPALYYKADGDAPDGIKWHPSIHMPREAARIFLRVTDVRVERLQDIDDDGVVAEGNEIGAPFDELWDTTIKPKDLALYGWDANPWVWVIEFERCEKPVGD